MTSDEIKTSIRNAVNAMVRGEAEDQETANGLIREAIRAKASKIVNPLVETASNRSSFKLSDIDYLGDAGLGYSIFDAEIKFEYEPEDYDDHPYGDTTARMHYSANIEIIDITSTTTIEELDEDGETVIKTWPIGTDIIKLPRWEDKHVEWFEKKAMEYVEEKTNDY